MTHDQVELLLSRWKRLDLAVKHVQLALPSQIGRRMEELEVAREEMNAYVTSIATLAIQENILAPTWTKQQVEEIHHEADTLRAKFKKGRVAD